MGLLPIKLNVISERACSLKMQKGESHSNFFTTQMAAWEEGIWSSFHPNDILCSLVEPTKNS